MDRAFPASLPVHARKCAAVAWSTLHARTGPAELAELALPGHFRSVLGWTGGGGGGRPYRFEDRRSTADYAPARRPPSSSTASLPALIASRSAASLPRPVA